jgi:nuclear cap-binding protein subunit 1
LLRKRAPETDLQPIIDSIQEIATQNGSIEPIIESTQVYMTAVCCVGAKSLSHVLSCIERCKERLLGIGAESEAARRQIISAVVSYWTDFPGTAVNIVDKLLNYTIITPESVVRWCLDSNTQSASGVAVGLADFWRYEMLASTMGKVTNRVRQIVAARVQATKGEIAADQLAIIDTTLQTDREGMRALFSLINELLSRFENAGYVESITANPEDAQHISRWAFRWTRVFKRKVEVEETVVSEAAVAATMVRAKTEWEREERKKQEEEAAETERKRILREREEEEERERLLKLEEEPKDTTELDVADGD